MTDSYLFVRFKQSPIDHEMMKVLRDGYDLSRTYFERFFHTAGAVIKTEKEKSGDFILEVEVPLKAPAFEDPMERLAYERLHWQQATLYRDVDFEIISMTADGTTWMANDLLPGDADVPNLAYVRLNTVGNGIYSGDWIRRLMPNSSVPPSEILEKVKELYHALQDYDEAYLAQGDVPSPDDETLNDLLMSMAPDIITTNEGKPYPIRHMSILRELKTFITLYPKVSSRCIAVPTQSPEKAIAELRERIIDGSDSAIPVDYLDHILAIHPEDTDNGKWLRYGMYLASQIAVDIMDGKGGTVNIRDLHARLAEVGNRAD